MSITSDVIFLDVPLLKHHKAIVEQAASQLGQSVREFAATALVRTAQEIVEEPSVTRLSNRDRDRFLAMLGDVDAEPNAALVEAAEFYKRTILNGSP